MAWSVALRPVRASPWVAHGSRVCACVVAPALARRLGESPATPPHRVSVTHPRYGNMIIQELINIRIYYYPYSNYPAGVRARRSVGLSVGLPVGMWYR